MYWLMRTSELLFINKGRAFSLLKNALPFLKATIISIIHTADPAVMDRLFSLLRRQIGKHGHMGVQL